MRKNSTESRLVSREDRFGILEEALRKKTRAWIEQMVNEELEAALGVGRHERAEGRRGYRKGKRNRTFTSRNGKHRIQMPRGEFFEPSADGKNAWTSKLLPPYVRRSDAVEDALRMCYLSGVNTRKVRAVGFRGHNTDFEVPTAPYSVAVTWFICVAHFQYITSHEIVKCERC